MAVSISSPVRERILYTLRLVTVVVATALIAYISFDTLANISPVADKLFLKVQLYTCLYFQLEIIAESIIWPRTPRNYFRLGAFFIICVPYLPLLHYYGVAMKPEIEYLLRFVPLLRGAAVLASLWGLMSKSWVVRLFRVYVILLLSTLYFLSLMFFVMEYHINPQITNFWDTVWYAIMQMTTCGSNISPVTGAGKAIGVILSAEGLILFPIFTVYFTHAFARTRAGQHI